MVLMASRIKPEEERQKTSTKEIVSSKDFCIQKLFFECSGLGTYEKPKAQERLLDILREASKEHPDQTVILQQSRSFKEAVNEDKNKPQRLLLEAEEIAEEVKSVVKESRKPEASLN